MVALLPGNIETHSRKKEIKSDKKIEALRFKEEH